MKYLLIVVWLLPGGEGAMLGHFYGIFWKLEGCHEVGRELMRDLSPREGLDYICQPVASP